MFGWLRWVFRRRTLQEILADHMKMQQELLDFGQRMHDQITTKKERVNQLGQEIVTHAEEMGHAQLFHDNIHRMMNEVLATKETKTVESK